MVDVNFRGAGRPEGLKVPDVGKIDDLHRKLGALTVSLPPEVTTESIRATFAVIRKNRNSVAAITAKALPALGRAKATAARIDRIIEAEASILRDAKVGMVGTKNEKDRQARVNVLLEDLLDAKTEVKMACAEIQELVGHCKIVMDELRAVFEETSRTLATYELDYRISKSDQY